MQFTNQATIEIYADGADINDMREMAKLPEVTGFTTNPSLMKRAGVTNYLAFAKQVVAEFPSMPVSFEVFTQDPDQIKEEATILSSLGPNVYVKVPILSLDGQPNINLLRELSNQGIKLNVTAITTKEQVRWALDALNPEVPAIVSLFVGRVADTGVDPTSFVICSSAMSYRYPNVKLLWASTREVDNIRQAEQSGLDIITVPPTILQKWLSRRDMTPADVALDTVRSFEEDIQALGFSILDDVADPVK